MRKNKAHKAGNEIQNLQIRIMSIYVVVILLTIGVVVGLTLERTKSVLSEKVSGLSAMVNSQMALNLQNYLDNIEENCTFIFTDKEHYTYTAEEAELTEYEHLTRRKTITAKLQEISLMESHSDFGIVYENGITVGKISEGTAALYGSDIFNILMSAVRDNAAQDGWSVGYNGDYDRLYYVKKLNEKAVIVSAIYTSELAEVFEKSDRMEDMTILLCDGNKRIMYSSETRNIGDQMNSNIAQLMGNHSEKTMMNDDYLISEEHCEGWDVLCYIPISSIMKEYRQLQMYIFVISGIVIFLTIVIGIRLSSVVANPITDMVNRLDKKASTDLLTHVLNKMSFENETEKLLLSEDMENAYAFMIIDVDDFKSVNDSLGHAYGDEVLENIAEILREVFWKNCLIGRVGGDEFAVLIGISADCRGEHTEYVQQLVQQLYESLKIWNRNFEKKKITLSTGIVFSREEDDFRRIYEDADKALYEVKRDGKNKYFIWDREESGQNGK